MQKKRLVRTLAVQTATYKTKKMELFIKQQVKGIKGCTLVNEDGNVYVTKGEADTYPCIIAHTDTVHSLVRDFKVLEINDKLFSIDESTMKRVGIGGDDKVGVFIALEVLRQTDVCKAVFFTDEEIGCVGSRRADMNFFKDTEFVLQCDRQGNKDFVNDIFYSRLYTDEFAKEIKPILDKYGMVETDGGLTDVYQLVDNLVPLEVCCANMSCGYYRPHTDNEFVVISEVFSTLAMVMEIFEKMSGRVWEMLEQNRVSHGYGRKKMYGGWEEWDDGYNKWSKIKKYNGEIDTYDDDDESPDCCPLCMGIEIFWDDSANEWWCFSCNEYLKTLEDEMERGVYGDDAQNSTREMREAEENRVVKMLGIGKGNDDDDEEDDTNEGIPY